MQWTFFILILAVLWVGYRVQKLHEFLENEIEEFKNPTTIEEDTGI